MEKKKMIKGQNAFVFHPTEQNPKSFPTVFKAEPTPSLTGTVHSFNKHLTNIFSNSLLANRWPVGRLVGWKNGRNLSVCVCRERERGGEQILSSQKCKMR